MVPYSLPSDLINITEPALRGVEPLVWMTVAWATGRPSRSSFSIS